jgi:hypothetical protein
VGRRLPLVIFMRERLLDAVGHSKAAILFSASSRRSALRPADTAPRGAAGGGWRRLAETGLSIRSWALAGNASRQLSALGAQDGDADNAPGDRFGSARPRGVDVVAAARVSITDWRRPRHHHDNRNLDRPQPHTAALFIQCAGMVTMAPGGISVLARAKRI